MDGTSQHARQRLGAFSGCCRARAAASRAAVTDERGAALVEFALVASLLLVLLFAVAELGVTLNNYLTLRDGVRAGARAAAVAATSPCAAATTTVQGRLSGAEVSCTAIVAGQPFTVTATYPYSIDLVGIAVGGDLTAAVTVLREED